MKIRRAIGVPAALLLYLIAIAIYAYPESGRVPQVTYSDWFITIGATLACIIILYFVLRKREKFRNTPKSPKKHLNS